MWIKLFNAFTKITGFPVYLLCFRTKIYYEDESCRAAIKGPAILISNHTSVMDYAVWLFVFFYRTVRFQMAEVLFKKKLLGLFLRMMGGIYVDRDSRNLGFIAKSEEILRRGGMVGIFPEGRLPRKGETRPLPFKTGAAYLALSTGVPVVPVYTNGSYFKKKRAAVVIGRPFTADELIPESAGDRESIQIAAEKMRERILELETILYERERRKQKK